MKSLYKILGILASSLILFSCSDDDSQSKKSLDDKPIQLSGVVSKGIIVNGLVKIYPVMSDGTISSDLLGTTSTDLTGKYSIETTSTGPVQIVIEPNPDGTSYMVCDVPAGCGPDVSPVDGTPDIAFGESYKFEFSMEAMVPVTTAGAISANVTPFTNMAAA